MVFGMKIILWATLTANGNYQRNDPQHPPRPEALADFAAHVRTTGNFIVGRKTFEGFAAQQAARDASVRAPDAGGLGEAMIVVVSSNSLPVPTARGPREALAVLRERGFSSVLVAGGATLHNAFLAEDLVDELVFNVAPAFEDDGLKLVLPKRQHRTLSLIETKPLGGGVVQLRYSLRE